MKNKFDQTMFRTLLARAIGKRTQKEFSEIAGLSPYNVNRMLSRAKISTPQRSTLRKIADASEGRVTETQLLFSCGYDVGANFEMTGEERSPQETALSLIQAIKKSVEDLCSSAAKYADLLDMFDTAAILSGKRTIRFVHRDEKVFEGTGRKGAEKYVFVTAISYADHIDIVMPFVLFFCKTEGGGYIFSDCAFDMDTLIEMEHPEAGKILFELAEKGDVNYSDYPFIFSCRRHIPGEAERRLLRAIFGEDADIDKKDDDSEDVKEKG